MDKVIYTAAATAVGGRESNGKTSDGIINMDLKTPVEMGGPGGGSNPEQLFAAGYSACFNSALNHLARLQRIRLGETQITISIDLYQTESGGFKLGAHIDALVPGVDKETAEKLAHEAHNFCPYSLATKGNIDVEIKVRTE